jgi:hypothetical protein
MLRAAALVFCVGLGLNTACSAGSEGAPATGSGGNQATGSGGHSGTGGTPRSNTGGTPAAGSGGGSGGNASGGSGSGGDPGTGGAASGGAGGSSSSDDAGVDASTDSTGVGGTSGPLPPGTRKVVLLVGDIHVTDPSRIQLLEILNGMKESHGVVAEVMDSRVAKAAVLMDAALVIAGPNNNYCSDLPDPSLKSLPVPIMVSRDCKTTAFGLGTMLNTQEYIANLPVPITIVKSDHPLAAGLTGVVPVLMTRCREVRGANLGPDAIKIARAPADAVPASADSWAIFAYEKGGTMVDGFKAPAKRMGFFWHRPSAVTPQGKKLFEAAVDWLLRP